MGSFIRRHWIAYIVGAALAILLGLGASYVLGKKWSTPNDVRREQIAKETQNEQENDALAHQLDGGSSSSASLNTSN